MGQMTLVSGRYLGLYFSQQLHFLAWHNSKEEKLGTSYSALGNRLPAYALPFYATALVAAVLTGIDGMLFGLNQPFYGFVFAPGHLNGSTGEGILCTCNGVGISVIYGGAQLDSSWL